MAVAECLKARDDRLVRGLVTVKRLRVLDRKLRAGIIKRTLRKYEGSSELRVLKVKLSPVYKSHVVESVTSEAG